MAPGTTLFRAVPSGLRSGDGYSALIPQLPAVYTYSACDTLTSLYHGAGFDQHEGGKLRRYFAARAQLKKYELRCRLVAFIAGAAAADTVAVVAQRRRAALCMSTEENIKRNPRMPESRQAALREQADSEEGAVLGEVLAFQQDSGVAAVAMRLPQWAGRTDVLAAALAEGDAEDAREGIARGARGQSTLELWGEFWVRQRGTAAESGEGSNIEALYEAHLVPPKVGTLPRFGTKLEVDGLFTTKSHGSEAGENEVEDASAAPPVLLALVEAKYGCTSVYEDVPRMLALLDYLGGVSRATFRLRKRRSALQGEAPQARREVTLPPAGTAEVEVHYVIGSGGLPPATVRDLIGLSALPTEAGRMLKDLTARSLKGDMPTAPDLGDVLEIVQGHTAAEDNEDASTARALKIRATLPVEVLAAARERMEAFSEELFRRLSAGQVTFWTEIRDD